MYRAVLRSFASIPQLHGYFIERFGQENIGARPRGLCTNQTVELNIIDTTSGFLSAIFGGTTPMDVRISKVSDYRFRPVEMNADHSGARLYPTMHWTCPWKVNPGSPTFFKPFCSRCTSDLTLYVHAATIPGDRLCKG